MGRELKPNDIHYYQRGTRCYFHRCRSGVLLNILPIRLVFPAPTGQSTIRPSAVQPNRTRLLGRPTVGFALRPVTTRFIGE